MGEPGMVDPGEDGTLARSGGEPGTVDPGEDEITLEGESVPRIGEPGMTDPCEDHKSARRAFATDASCAAGAARFFG